MNKHPHEYLLLLKCSFEMVIEMVGPGSDKTDLCGGRIFDQILDQCFTISIKWDTDDGWIPLFLKVHDMVDGFQYEHSGSSVHADLINRAWDTVLAQQESLLEIIGTLNGLQSLPLWSGFGESMRAVNSDTLVPIAGHYFLYMRSKIVSECSCPAFLVEPEIDLNVLIPYVHVLDLVLLISEYVGVSFRTAIERIRRPNSVSRRSQLIETISYTNILSE